MCAAAPYATFAAMHAAQPPLCRRFAASLLSTTRTGAFLPFFTVSLLGKVSYINVIATRAVKHVGGLSYPFVGDPL